MILLSASIPAGFMIGAWKGLSVSFHEYQHRTRSRDGELGEPVAQSVDVTARPVPPWLRAILPRGRWMPNPMRQRYGTLYGGPGRYERMWVTLAFWSPTILLIGLALQPTDGACTSLFAVLAALEFLFAIMILVIRPLRSLPANLVTSVSNAALGVVLAATAVQARNPESSNARWFMLKAVQAPVGCIAIRITWDVFQFITERKVLAKLPLQEVKESRWNGGSSLNTASDALKGKGDVQEELLEINVAAASSTQPENFSRGEMSQGLLDEVNAPAPTSDGMPQGSHHHGSRVLRPLTAAGHVSDDDDDDLL